MAEAAGWALTFEGCSRFQQATGRAYSRAVEGNPAALSIRAELRTAPESSRRKDTLTVSFTDWGADLHVDVGLRRKDLGCLTGLDPSGPEMVQPKTDRVTPEELCAAVCLDGLPVQDRYPTGEPGDGEPSSCSFNGGDRVGELFSVGEAGFPLVFYQDRSVEDAAPGQRFSFGSDESAGVWLMGRRGPLVVTIRSSPLGQFEISPERLQRIADDLAAL